MTPHIVHARYGERNFKLKKFTIGNIVRVHFVNATCNEALDGKNTTMPTMNLLLLLF